MHIKKVGGSLLLLALAWLTPVSSNAQDLDPVLRNLIEKGIDKSHELNNKEFEAQQAVIDQKLARAVFLPKITLNGNYTRLDSDISFDEDTQQLLTGTQKLIIKEAAGIPFNSEFPAGVPVQPIPAIQESNILKSSVDLDWTLFSGFQASNALKASKHKEASINYAALAMEDKIALKIIETYDQLALVNASAEVLETTEDYLEQQEKFVQKAIENGLATPIERKKVELALQQLIARQLEFEQNRTILIELLHMLTGEQKNVLSAINPQLGSMGISETEQAEKRDEIKALEEAETASLYKAKMQRNNFIPKIALKGHYELLEDDLSLLDPKWYVGVGIRWNVFDGNKSRLEAKKSQLEAEKYREQREDAEEKIALSMIKAQQNLEASQQNTRIVQKEIELAMETYELTDKQYRNDLAPINDVLDALRDLEKAEFKLQDSYFQERRAKTELLHAQGKLNY
ncbi:TolC family protein [Pontixanthobacter gangjinensis]|uniref:TolC family protein n=1 Tax=Christiangramia aestuarii TaxID=1028746 RepID=A0A7M3SY10_9FLAO|nr:TolC family protein [Christiangramia aestuarii]MUP41491.1 TolC family protein [Christiangramia aestuarii]